MRLPAAPSTTAQAIFTDLSLNVPRLQIEGSRVRVEALLDVAGLELLEKRIRALREFLSPWGETTPGTALVIASSETDDEPKK